MLDAARLRDNLRRFCDPGSTGPAGFTGFPATRDAARQAWADAFSEYFDQVEELVPAPPPGHPSLVTTHVGGRFKDDLGLAPTMAAAAAAADIAGAWQAAIGAITFAAVTDSGGNVWTPAGFSNVAANRGALLGTLTGLFASPATSAIARLGEIAEALHRASSTLIATVSVVNASGVTLPIVTMHVH
jgi:hypothetical protein